MEKYWTKEKLINGIIAAIIFTVVAITLEEEIDYRYAIFIATFMSFIIGYAMGENKGKEQSRED